MGKADESLSDLSKLGRRVEQVAADIGFKMQGFSVMPSLHGDSPPSINLVLMFDPENETKPKVEIVQLEGSVTEAFDEAQRDALAEKADKAKRELAEDLDKNLRGRGGFLGDPE